VWSCCNLWRLSIVGESRNHCPSEHATHYKFLGDTADMPKLARPERSRGEPESLSQQLMERQLNSILRAEGTRASDRVLSGRTCDNGRSATGVAPVISSALSRTRAPRFAGHARVTRRTRRRVLERDWLVDQPPRLEDRRSRSLSSRASPRLA